MKPMTRWEAMADRKVEDTSPDEPVELPPSETWSPEQALAAAARVPWVEVVIIGEDGSGDPPIRHSRMTPERMLWLADILRDYARTM